MYPRAGRDLGTVDRVDRRHAALQTGTRFAGATLTHTTTIIIITITTTGTITTTIMDRHGHSHVPEGEITLGSLIALGASGGLVPCPSALVLLLSSIALGRVALGLLLLVGFSLGLAAVLMGIGMLVLYAKNLLPDSNRTAQNAAFRVIPVLSAAVIVCLGLLMTGVSLGVIRPSRFIG